jgi:radical SAM protein with 4Fe4S-binding SPASM domain
VRNTFVKHSFLPEFNLWEKTQKKRSLVSFELELTARCNHNCRHCYINLPVEDKEAGKKELPFDAIKRIADQAVSLGALWCFITGGEPLLREDFFDIYVYLKKKGLLVSVFTNAGLITKKHIELFEAYPPRDIEVTVYAVTKNTYERITRAPGSFDAFLRGLNLLLENGIKVRLKTMALCSNAREMPEIARFCREKTKDYFRFDPFLHLRFDGNQARNEEMKSERLSPHEIVEIEQSDSERSQALEKSCGNLINPGFSHTNCNHLFHCGAGNGSFTVSYDGFFRLCSSLWHPDCIFDLKQGSLADAWQNFVPRVRNMRSNREDFLKKCRRCTLINLCMWCPAHAYLETGRIDEPVDYFCELARARAEALGYK